MSKAMHEDVTSFVENAKESGRGFRYICQAFSETRGREPTNEEYLWIEAQLAGLPL